MSHASSSLNDAASGPITAATTLQLTVYLRSTGGGVFGPVLARFETRNVREGHLEERGELWSSDGKLLAQSQQLALLSPTGSR